MPASEKRAVVRPIDVPEDEWSEAVRREGQVRTIAAKSSIGRNVAKSVGLVLGLSTAQVYRLVTRFRAASVTQSLVRPKPGPVKGARQLPAATELCIEDAIETLFKKREAPSMDELRRAINHNCHAAGLKSPSRTAIQARVSTRSLKEMVRAREGAEAARQRFVPVKAGLRPRVPLAVVQIDHTKVDIQLVDDLTRTALGRPWLTVMLDVFSRSVVGFHLSFDAPSAGGVALAIAQGVLSKQDWLSERDLDLAWPMHGLPRGLHLDNGQEFHSRALKRGCQQHGMRIDYRPPATPRFGGHIERLMGTLMKRLHGLPGRTSSNIQSRGDYRSEDKAILTLTEFERVLTLEILGPYHHEVHAALGTTPAAVWAEGTAAAGAVTPPSDPAAFVLDFLPFEERVVRREGVRLFHILYFDGALAPLLESPERRCRIKYSPRDMSAVFVELPAGGHLRLPYADLGKPPVSLWEQQAATRALHREGHGHVDEAAIFAAIVEKRRVLTEAQTKSKAARRAIARLPAGIAEAAAAAAPSEAGQDDAGIPALVEDDAWKTEFLL
jgi:putative transposase